MHKSSYNLMEQFAKQVKENFSGQQVNLMDIGSSDVNGSYKPLFNFEGVNYIGLDIEQGPNVNVAVKDPYDWKEVEDDSIDVIISGQAIEHIPYPWITFEQIAKKLKPGGIACIIAPSRGPVHRYPVDCYRFYPDGMRALAEWAGLIAMEASYIEGKSGFNDGSDNWGDCHCIIRKPFTDELDERKQSTRRPAINKPEAVKHTSNPLNSGTNNNYYQFERADVVNAIRTQKLNFDSVLELGCAAGATGKKLKQEFKITRYAGIEPHWEAAQLARDVLDEVYPVNIEEVDLQALGLKPDSFDLLLALDVLEHLYNPWDILVDLAEYVRPGGSIVLSIPNVRHASVVQNLVNGNWTYTDAGLLDATHIRFFTLQEMQKLIGGAGLQLIHTEGVITPKMDFNQLKDSDNELNLGNIKISGLSKNDAVAFFIYQYILVIKKPERT